MNCIYQYMVINKSVDERGSIEGRDRSRYYQECFEISRDSFIDYAASIDAEYKSTQRAHPWFSALRPNSKFSVFFDVLAIIHDPEFEKYDKVLFVDSDIYCNTRENIFDTFEQGTDVMGILESDIVTQNGGGYNSWDFKGKQMDQIREKYAIHKCPVVPTSEPNRPSNVTVMNTGVMVWSREAREHARESFTHWLDWIDEDLPMWLAVDQMYLSAMFMKHNMKLQTIDQTWNETPSGFNDDSWQESKFIHYTGGDGKAEMVKDFYQGKLRDFDNIWEGTNFT